METTLLIFAGAGGPWSGLRGRQFSRKESTMYFGYGVGGVILLVVVFMLLTGRL
jgi:hypothetical protein